MRAAVEDVIARFATGTVAATAVAGYVTAGAVVMATRALLDTAQGAVGRLPGRGTGSRSGHGTASMRHTLRVVIDEFTGAEAFAHQGDAAHIIRYDPTTRYAKAALAHEFAHVLLAVIRGAPPEGVEVPAEECAAWALARAITKGAIWTGAATTYREHALATYGVPAWARAPRIPPPTRVLVRWLAQMEP